LGIEEKFTGEIGLQAFKQKDEHLTVILVERNSALIAQKRPNVQTALVDSANSGGHPSLIGT
jgi:hypothetical protein